jgi:SAM-dependent MidA family methyltransferase
LKNTNVKDFSWHNALLPNPRCCHRQAHDHVRHCQELVDALSIHSVQKVEGGVWRERLINVAIHDDSEASGGICGRVVVRQYATADAANASPVASPVLSSSKR